MTRDAKAEAVLARICNRVGSVGKTQAVKLPYLADVISNNMFGKLITQGKHETWKHGVVCRPLYRLLTHDEEERIPFRVEALPWAEDSYQVSLSNESAIEAALSDQECAVVDFVADEYANMTATRLGQLTKRLNPKSEWGTNQPADHGEEAYDHLTPGFQEMADTVDSLDLTRIWRESVPIADPRQAPVAGVAPLLSQAP